MNWINGARTRTTSGCLGNVRRGGSRDGSKANIDSCAEACASANLAMRHVQVSLTRLQRR